MSDKNNIQILVPPGFGNAHYVKTKKAIFHYKQSTFYNRKSQFTINWKDPNYNFKWPKKIKPIMSKRDNHLMIISRSPNKNFIVWREEQISLNGLKK